MSSSGKIGILISNLGTPDAPTAGAVRRFLAEYLSDPMVVGARGILWSLLLNLLILPFRPSRSAKIYAQIWEPEGSPLLLHSRNQLFRLRGVFGDAFPVELGMRYGEPSLSSAIDNLIGAGCSRIVVFPLYPQACSVTTGSTMAEVAAALKRRSSAAGAETLPAWHTHPAYLGCLGSVVNEELAAQPDKHDALLLSYHGVPEKLTTAGERYTAYCEQTSAALRPYLHFRKESVLHCYHSRFGRGNWSRPYIEDVLRELLAQGKKRVAVAFPGFTCDCLETSYDIGIERKSWFLKVGGESLITIPCLNEHSRWIRAMEELIRSFLSESKAVSGPSGVNEGTPLE